MPWPVIGTRLNTPSALQLVCLAICIFATNVRARAQSLPELHPPVESTAATLALDAGSLTDHFRSWLRDNGYAEDDFARDDLVGGSFGGKLTQHDALENQPVVFVHGNSDKAMGENPGQTGWTASIRYFLAQDYTPAELYATTWGPADASRAAQQYHARQYLTRTRRFLQAVLAYTGAEKIDVIAHSMGVTLARKAIKGGPATDSLAGGDYDLGAPLTSRIDTFVGIAGANRGLVSCFMIRGTTPTCGAANGLNPGYLGFFGTVLGVSKLLTDINARAGYEGAYVFTIWSRVDQIIGFGGLVYGRYTSRIPAQDGEIVFDAAPYGHFNAKDLTPTAQLQMVKYHAVQ